VTNEAANRMPRQPVLHNTDFLGDTAADCGEATDTAAVWETTATADCATTEGHSEPTSNSDAQPSDQVLRVVLVRPCRTASFLLAAASDTN
jgi:hypothetical protein